MFQGLRAVVYGVSDIEKAKTWYTSVLGEPPYFDQPFYVGFNVAGYELGLDPNASPVSAGSAGVVACWGVDDIQQEYERLLSLARQSTCSSHRRGRRYPNGHSDRSFRQHFRTDLQSPFSGKISMKRRSELLKEFQVIPGVGPSIAQDFIDLGYSSIKELRSEDPEKIYQDLCRLRAPHRSLRTLCV